MRRLIINADDFGLTPGINRGIIEAHQARIVTSATLMATGQRFGEALQLANTTPQLSVGCHIVLIDGTAASDPQNVRSLARGDSQFRQDLSSFALGALTGQIKPAHVEAEAAAQIRKLQSAGVGVSHVDTHKHTHVFPAIWKPLLEAARACGVRAIRNPFVASRPMPMARLRQRPYLAKRYFQVTALRALWQRQFKAAVEAAGMMTPDGSFGVIETGYLDAEVFEGILSWIPEGTWELVCHPGYEDVELATMKTRLRQSRKIELDVLTSPLSADLLKRHDIELISYRDLAESRSR